MINQQDSFLATAIRCLLKRDKKEAKEMADALGVSHRTVNYWIKGDRGVSKNNLFAVASFFRIEYDEMLSLGEHLESGGTYESWKATKTVSAHRVDHDTEDCFREAVMVYHENSESGGMPGLLKEIEEKANIARGKISDYLYRGADLTRAEKKEIVQRINLSYNRAYSYQEFLDLGKRRISLSKEGIKPDLWALESDEPRTLRERALASSTVQKRLSRTVPLISWVRAGAFCEVEDNFQPGDAEEWINCESKVSVNAFALTIKGDSMEPEFRAGERIIIDPAIQPETGKFVVAKVESDAGVAGEATFKQFIRDGDHVYLKPLNSAYPMMDMTGKKFFICGCVVEKNKKY